MALSETVETVEALRSEVASLQNELDEVTLGRDALEQAMRVALEQLDALEPYRAWSTLAEALGMFERKSPWNE